MLTWDHTELVLHYITLILSNHILHFPWQYRFRSLWLVRNCEITTLLEHSWKWDYLNALASGDVWIIIQPFFRRLEPKAAAVSRRRRRRRNRKKVKMKWRRRSSGDIMWRNQKKTRNKWREWHPLENLSKQKWTTSQTVHMCIACTKHICAPTQYTLTRFYWQNRQYAHTYT